MGSEGLSEGSEGLTEGSEGQSQGSKGLPDSFFFSPLGKIEKVSALYNGGNEKSHGSTSSAQSLSASSASSSA